MCRTQKADPGGDRAVALSKMLFATDFSAACANAWPYALAISRRYQSKMFVVHVIAPSQFASVPPELFVEAKKETRLNAENEMMRLQQLHGGAAGLDVEISILEGDISEALLLFEENQDIDLLVAGTRGHRRLDRLLLGSVAEKLFRQSRCPVLVVPERVRSGPTETVNRILYPTDFSRASSDARAYAMSLTHHFGAQLILVHVVNYVESKSPEDLARDKVVVLSKLNALLPSTERSADVRFEVAFGEPARNICRIAAEYDVDLIVIGVQPADATVAHEEERTAYRVILAAPCPVLTVAKSNQVAHDNQRRS